MISDDDIGKVRLLSTKIVTLMQKEDASPEQGINALMLSLAICCVQSDLDKAFLLNRLGNNIDLLRKGLI
jgi:hypothetical protein